MSEKKGILGTAVVISAIVCGFLLFLCCKLVATPQDAYLNIAIMMASICVGWLLGTFISPASNTEAARFGVYGKAVSAFVSGYLVAKLDKVIEKILSPDTLAVPIAAFRLTGGIAALVSAVLVTYIVRAYVYGGDPKRAETKKT